MWKWLMSAAYVVVIVFAFWRAYAAETMLDTVRCQMVGCTFLICAHLFLFMEALGAAKDGKKRRTS